MPTGAYRTAEIAQITGFTTRQLDYWARRGLIVPGVRQAHGSGSRRLYSFDNLIHLAFIRHLERHGWSRRRILSAITTLRSVVDDPNPLRNAVLVDGKGTVLALCKTKEGERVLLDALSAAGQQVMEIVLDTLEEEARLVLTLLSSGGQASNETRTRGKVASQQVAGSY